MNIKDQTPLGVHYKLFIPTLKNLCNSKQVEKFLRPAEKLEIVGCYAQTELSHGSDIVNMETTAEYDPTHQEFIIDSPTIGSTKWWVG